jgi:preprotein translocase subunit SecA
MSIFKRVLRTGEGRKLKALQSLVPDINALELDTRALSDDALRAKTAAFKQRLERGEDLDDLLVEAFAVVREASTRVIGQRHYDVQMMGGAALHLGWVAEMKTGEGKTLVSSLPVYLNALAGKGMHIVTVNDYLASRDANWMGQIHKFLGLTVGLVVPGQPDHQYKRAQYAADITYGTNNEFGFDYLRDNMAMSLSEKVQRGHQYCIVDEIDSILIDEARTPLIISGRVADAAKLYYRFASIARSLTRDAHYDVDEEKRIVAPTEAGIHEVERQLGIDNLYDELSANLVHQLTAALRAKELYRRDKDYIIQEGEVKIVDEFTGRVLDGRRWSEGLHQAVEAKEGVKIKEENQTLATITLQNYFRLYDKLAGMTGTAETEAAELYSTYQLQVVPIPTHRPLVRLDQGDLIYKTEAAKYDAVVEDLVTRHETGQPVLVGTVSVEKSELLGRQLQMRGIPHEVLNAKQHTREAHIVAQAGRLNAITVATNMAGRGVDILLGGNPEGMATRDLQAEGLDPDTPEGETRFAELLALHKPQCEAEGNKVRELGGLYVLGTERHESRRIDNQLRGRSGRQGDPGESRFYLSLEDELMRIFATGALNWVMGKALPDEVPIEAKMVSKAIERAQNTVETRNAEIRKNVLKYDEVTHEQRKVIYKRRDQILGQGELRNDLMQALAGVVDGVISNYCQGDDPDEWELDAMLVDLRNYWPLSVSLEQLADAQKSDGVYDTLMGDATAHYEARENEVTPEVMRQVERQVMLQLLDQRWREHLYDMDYLREGIHLRAYAQIDPTVAWQSEGYTMFSRMMGSIDDDFVRYLMHVQVAVNEPEPIEAKPAVSNMEYSAPADPSESSGLAGSPAAALAPATTATGAPGDRTAGERTAADERAAAEADAGVIEQPTVKSEWDKTPRNAPCPCGSGKKFKLCHGK